MLHLISAVVRPVGGSSEAREAHIVSTIVTEGEWVLPLRNGIVPSKPPLHHWLGACIALLTGARSDTAARTSAVLFGMFALVLTMWVAKFLYRAIPYVNEGEAEDVSLLAGVVLATTWGFSILASDARVDMTFSSLVIGAVACGIHALVSRDEPSFTRGASRSMTLFFLLSGLAVVAKGPLGAVLPGWILFWCAVSVDGFPRAARLVFRPRVSWLLFLVIALPWYLLAFERGGASFAERQLLFENLKRVAGGENMNTEVWWFYVPSFFRTALPWSLIFLSPLALFVQRIHRRGIYPFSDRDYRLRLIPIVWLISGILLFSIPAGKRHSYLAPLFPGMAIAVAFYLNRFLRPVTNQGKRYQEWLVVVGAGVCLLGLASISLVAAGAVVPQSENAIPLLNPLQWVENHRLWFQIPSSIGVLFLFSALIFTGRPRGVALSGGVIILMGVGMTLGLGVKGELKGFDRMATRIQTITGGSPIAVYKRAFDEYLDPVLYYLGRPVQILTPRSGSIPCSGYLLGRESFLRKAFGDLDGRGELVEQFSEASRSLDGADHGANNGKRLALFRCLVPVLETNPTKEGMDEL